MAHKILLTEDALDDPVAAARFGNALLNHVELLATLPGGLGRSFTLRCEFILVLALE